MALDECREAFDGVERTEHTSTDLRERSSKDGFAIPRWFEPGADNQGSGDFAEIEK